MKSPTFSPTRLRKAIEAAPEEAWTEGMDWYADAQRWCRRTAHAHDLTPHTVAGVVAALSPGVGWEVNKRACNVFIASGKAAGYPLSTQRAREILDGERPLDVLGGNKVCSFYRNIAYQCPESVTIDRHAASVLTGIPSPRWADDYKNVLERAGVYEHAADIYRTVADEYDILPHQCQAITWLAHRMGRPSRYIAK